jgi:hypothetical protein
MNSADLLVERDASDLATKLNKNKSNEKKNTLPSREFKAAGSDASYQLANKKHKKFDLQLTQLK